MTPNTAKLVVITGPAGVGKSTIVKEVLRRTGADYSVSATTRKPRPGEVDGNDYRFVDRKTFEGMVQAGELLESAEVHGNMYGTPAAPVRQAISGGKTIILDIDVQGGMNVAANMPGATFVLLLPPSEQELARRLRGRGTEDEATQLRRLAKAKWEIATAAASGVYNHQVINDDLEAAIAQVVEIVNQENAGK